jgi:hypothetical protein
MQNNKHYQTKTADKSGKVRATENKRGSMMKESKSMSGMIQIGKEMAKQMKKHMK